MDLVDAIRGRSWKRGSCTLFLALLLLGGALEIHPRDEALHAANVPVGESFAPEAVHPREAHHFEAGSTAHHPVCPACLLHLLNAGAQVPASLGELPPLAVAALASGERLASGRLVAADGAARAPPLT